MLEWKIQEMKMIRTIDLPAVHPEIIAATSAIVEIRFTGKKPIGIFANIHGAALVDRFLSGYVNLHNLLSPSERPTFGQCGDLLESLEGRAREFSMGNNPRIMRTYDFIFVPEDSRAFYQSGLEGGLNLFSEMHLRETFPVKLGYSLDGEFVNLRQAEKISSPRLKALPRIDEKGYVRNP
ncbi:hypothetical protein CO038_04420 [Candidatus Pacearchaeota archaeon CG_4_9_14_0_2_um_filter_39_13]|nr:hypothetical protein [Candidatus Pacearchaeota archaeon]OIO42597.1 MAG: hypothetical protein AUJ64_03890 [Candidatus Pacearchaeota archaeon CG1_02_39_14]PJC44313.1 MAG: hypothetical protein CO038_04420 [Candidatus Pacearchaeota archaeon CG_4_9_14_0_2_um_filter_39_13]